MQKKLYRSSRDKVLGGVAAGIGNYFDIDPTLVRVLFVISLLLGGTGILAYILLWIFIPEEPLIKPENEDAVKEEGPIEKNFNPYNDPEYQHRKEERRARRMVFAGIVLILLGLIFLADNFIPRFDFGDFLPVLLIALGAWFLFSSRKNQNV